MGRYSQRKRSGGGPPVLNHMTEAVDFDPAGITVTYSQPIDFSQLSPGAFASFPSSTSCIAITPLAAREAEYVFGFDIDTDTTLVYVGTTPGVLTPQTINH